MEVLTILRESPASVIFKPAENEARTAMMNHIKEVGYEPLIPLYSQVNEDTAMMKKFEARDLCKDM